MTLFHFCLGSTARKFCLHVIVLVHGTWEQLPILQFFPSAHSILKPRAFVCSVSIWLHSLTVFVVLFSSFFKFLALLEYHSCKFPPFLYYIAFILAFVLFLSSTMFCSHFLLSSVHQTVQFKEVLLSNLFLVD